MLNESVRIALQVAFAPAVWLLLSRFSNGPATRFVFRYLSYRIARILTRKILERR